MRSAFSRAVLVASIASLTLCCLSCTRKKGSESAGLESAKAGAFLLKIPEDALGYFHWSTDSSAYRRFKKSPWNSGESFLASLDSINTATASKGGMGLQALSEMLKKSELIGTRNSKKEIIAEGAAFLSPLPNPAAGKLPLQAALFLKGTGKANLKSKFKEMQEALNKDGYKTEDLKIGGNYGFALTIPPESSANSSNNSFKWEGGKVFFTASKQYSAIASSPHLAAMVYGKGKSKRLKLQNSDYYKSTQNALKEGKARFGSAYLDFTGLVSTIQSYVAAAPASVKKQLTALTDVPVQSIGASFGFPDRLVSILTISLNSKNEKQKSFLNAIHSSSGKTLLGATPGDVIGTVQIDGKSVAAAVNSTLASLPAQNSSSLASKLAFLNQISRIGVAVKNSGNASPFPELLILAEAQKAPALLESLRTRIKEGLASSGMPSLPWNKKTIDGIQVDYAMTPFGIGIYTAARGDVVMASSSEGILESAILAASRRDGGLYSVLPQRDKEHLGSKTVLFTYIDFAKAADTVQSIQGTLSMFTGGKPSMDQSRIDALRQIGSVLYSAQFDRKILKINGEYSPPKQQG